MVAALFTFGLDGLDSVRDLFTFGLVGLHLARVCLDFGQSIVYVWLGWLTFG